MMTDKPQPLWLQRKLTARCLYELLRERRRRLLERIYAAKEAT